MTDDALTADDAPAAAGSDMDEQIHEVILRSLREMNYDTTGIEDGTLLGPAGADLESLALAELLVRVEDAFGVRFEDDEAEQLAVLTVGEFKAAVAARLGADAEPSAVG